MNNSENDGRRRRNGKCFYLEELLVDFEREDVDRLIFAFDAQRGRVFGRSLLRHDRVPFLDEEPRRDAVHRDAHRACHIKVRWFMSALQQQQQQQQLHRKSHARGTCNTQVPRNLNEWIFFN